MPMTPRHLQAAPPREVLERYAVFRSKLPKDSKSLIPDFESGTVSFIGEGTIRYVFRIPFPRTPTRTAVLKIGKEFQLEDEARRIKNELVFLRGLELSTIVVPKVHWIGGDLRTGEPGRDWGIIKTDMTENGLYTLEDVGVSQVVPVSLLTRAFHNDLQVIDIVLSLDPSIIYAALAVRKLADGTPHSLCFSDMDNFKA